MRKPAHIGDGANQVRRACGRTDEILHCCFFDTFRGNEDIDLAAIVPGREVVRAIHGCAGSVEHMV